MLTGLDSLGDICSRKKFKPDDLQAIYYLFFTNGIGFNEFNELPIPYIIDMIKTHNYAKTEEAKVNKRKK